MALPTKQFPLRMVHSFISEQSYHENMTNRNDLDAFFPSNPLYRGMAEKIILVGTGIYGLVFREFRCVPFPALA